MKGLTLRGIDDKTYQNLKQLSHQVGVSINKLVVKSIKRMVGTEKIDINHDFDDFFGSWDKSNYEQVQKSVKALHKIDKELWK